jgi:hypothetical protein
MVAHIDYNCTTFMAEGIREAYDLIADPSLPVIVNIGSANACSDDFEQYIRRMPEGRSGLFNDFNLPNSGENKGFHTSGLMYCAFSARRK